MLQEKVGHLVAIRQQVLKEDLNREGSSGLHELVISAGYTANL